MAASQREFVVNYGKLQDEPAELIDALIAAAENYLANSGILPELAPQPLYDLAVAGITAHYNENRAAVDQSSPRDFESGLRLIINGLKRECEVATAAGGAECV